jgi:hypothetical protein
MSLHFLAFTMHHIVCDGWSNGILIRDFTDLYTAFARGREADLPELPFQFADFTVWQQNWLESEAATAAVKFWRGHIQRELPAVDLPTDRPRLPQKSYPGTHRIDAAAGRTDGSPQGLLPQPQRHHAPGDAGSLRGADCTLHQSE